MKRKGQATGVVATLGVFLLLIVLGVLVSVTTQINNDIQDGFVTNAAGCNSTTHANCGFDFNASQNVLVGQDSFGGQMPTVFLIAAIGLVIATLLGAFAFARLRG